MRGFRLLYKLNLKLNLGRSSKCSHGWHLRLAEYQKMWFSSSILHHPSTKQKAILRESNLCGDPLIKLEAALEENCVDEAWEVFRSYKCLHGFPKQKEVKKMISLMIRPLSSHWLQKAHDLVLVIERKNPYLLDYDSLIRLALNLARDQMPVFASTMMRIALERFKWPSFDILSTVFFHLVKSDNGSYLASNILVENCERLLHNKPDLRNYKQLKLSNQSVTLFNIVLDSCTRFQSLQKALLLLKFMSQIGVVADANSIIIIAQLYGKLGQRDEVVRLKEHVDNVVVSMTLNRHYRPFYDVLLSLHFRYDDLDAAMELMLDLYCRSKPDQCSDDVSVMKNVLRKPYLLQVGSSNLIMGYKVAIEPDNFRSDFIIDLQGQSSLVLFSNGKLVPSTKAFAMLINGFVKKKKVTHLSQFIIDIENRINDKECSFSTFVLSACIRLGWLDTAHDVLDGLEVADIIVDANVYILLFQAYCKKNLFEESKIVLEQMRKADLLVNSLNDDGDCSIQFLRKKVKFSESNGCLTSHLKIEFNSGVEVCSPIHELNSTVLFFCKANMMEDAIRTVKRMQENNIQPTIQTFSYLLDGYSSSKMYREITMLWGEFKRRLEDGVLSVNRDMFHNFLTNFIRGGYFERVMEVANYMIRHNMLADRRKFKEEFLNLHKDLYRNLRTELTQTDAQKKRLEHVHAFRKWVNIT